MYNYIIRNKILVTSFILCLVCHSKHVVELIEL